MQKTFESLKDNDIEIIVIAYLLKHLDLPDSHFEHLDNTLFANAENLKFLISFLIFINLKKISLLIQLRTTYLIYSLKLTKISHPK